MNRTRLLGIGLLFLSLIFFLILYSGNAPQNASRFYSNHDTLNVLWQNYKKEFVNENGRTIDPASSQGKSITTSEGQSYTMLRAVWMGDREVFDQSLEWAKKNLQREDNLFSWLYGERSNGGLGILEDKGGENTASDADVDIALSLIFAYARWDDEAYLEEAKRIMQGIWNEEVVVINGVPYLTANSIERNSPKPIINPSYLAPYAYRVFAAVDNSPEREWGRLVDSSYDILNKSIVSSLDKQTSVSLPPNWVRINKATGELESTNTEGLTTDYGFDALRTPWRLALDAKWYGDPRAVEILSRLSFLEREWEKQGFLFAVYSHDGKVVERYETPALYGGSIGYFIASDSEYTDEIFREKLQVLFDPDTQSWKKELSYYDDNWVWFGTALYLDLLPNLAKSVAF